MTDQTAALIKIAYSLNASAHGETIADAFFDIAKALNKIASALDNCAPEAPIHGETFGGMTEMLGQIAQAIAEKNGG